jgi:hypothetical protein
MTRAFQISAFSRVSNFNRGDPNVAARVVADVDDDDDDDMMLEIMDAVVAGDLRRWRLGLT